MAQFFNVTSNAESLHRGYDAKAWDALLSGDLETALKAEGRFLDPATGLPLTDEQQAEVEAALAAAREAHASQARPPSSITAMARKPKANTGHGGLLDQNAVASRHIGPRGDGPGVPVHLSAAPGAPSLIRDLVEGLVK